MQRVLHLIDTSGVGGAETVFSQIVSGLDPGRFESVAVVPERGWLYDRLVASGVQPILTPSHGAFDVRYLRRLRAVLREHRIDIVHAHLLSSAVYGGVAAATSRIPLVATFHGTADLKARYLRAKAVTVNCTAGRIVFVSDQLRIHAIHEAGFAARRTEVIHNGVNVDQFVPSTDHEMRRKLGVAEDEFLVGAVGRIVDAKGFDLLLRAAARLRARSSRFRFLIVGDPEPTGEVNARLLALRSELGLEESVRVLEFREDMPRIYNSMDMLAVTSRTEGFSLVTVEAMACGLPVVATRCGGPEEIVTDAHDGVLIPVEDVDAIVTAIARVEEGQEFRRALAQNARATALHRFSREQMLRRYEGIYETLIAS